MSIERHELNTIQKRNRLNCVMFDPTDVGPGGAYHNYEIYREDNHTKIADVHFQRGPRLDPDSIHGVLDTDLLEIVRHRLQMFQEGQYATRENACALTHIEEALMWMNKRVEDRAARGVLGTTEK